MRPDARQPSQAYPTCLMQHRAVGPCSQTPTPDHSELYKAPATRPSPKLGLGIWRRASKVEREAIQDARKISQWAEAKIDLMLSSSSMAF